MTHDRRDFTTARARSSLKDPRPKYLDLLRIRLPVPGLLSILHRISGFCVVPGDAVSALAVAGEPHLAGSYVRYRAVFAHPLVKLMLIGLAMGVLASSVRRYPLSADGCALGIELQRARASSSVVIAAAIVCTIVLGVLLW